MNAPDFYTSMTPRARLGLLVGAALILGLAATALWWALSPRQELLFGDLRETEAAEIVQSLDEWKVPYRIVASGSGITVPSDVVYATRMRLVSAGVPRGGHVGFELFDDSDFGVTEFAQRVNYQRALQGEIERTISALPGVETARVHLTIRRPGLFVGEREASKASVAVGMRHGQALSRQQVTGIRGLVAAAVEGLDANAVSVLDTDGALLAGSDSAVDTTEREAEEAQLEARIQARVSGLIGQILSSEQFHVSVDATLNFDTVRQVNERLITQGGDGGGVLVRKRVHSSDPANGDGSGQNQEESEYRHGTTREEISRAPGRLERLTIAVVLPPTLEEYEVTRIQSLVAASAGIDESRGDRLEVSRVGRVEAWQTGSAVGDVGPGALRAPVSDEGVIDPIHPEQPGAWRRWLPLLAGALLLGVIAALATQRRPRRLKADERDAVLVKLKSWLAEGGTAP